MHTSQIIHSARVLCSLFVLISLYCNDDVEARLVWIPRLDNEKDISKPFDGYPTFAQVYRNLDVLYIQ